jgi:hypothetical protein
MDPPVHGVTKAHFTGPVNISGALVMRNLNPSEANAQPSITKRNYDIAAPQAAAADML